MGEILEFCFRPPGEYLGRRLGPSWFLDPFIEEELWPRLHCPACGKPRWLAIDADEFADRFSLDVGPEGHYAEPYAMDRWRCRVTDVKIYVLDQARKCVTKLWDVRIRGERSIREQCGISLPDSCTFGPLTPCERMVCAVCGNENWSSAELTPVVTQPGDIVWVCRHGHFMGQSVNPFTSMIHSMTGPKMLDTLIWAPELFVPKLKWRWWGPPDIKRGCCEL